MTDSTPTPECPRCGGKGWKTYRAGTSTDICKACHGTGCDSTPTPECGACGSSAGVEDLSDQIAALTAERDEALQRWQNALDMRNGVIAERDHLAEWRQKWEDRAYVLEAERDRYRDALERIVDKYGTQTALTTWGQIARAALTPIEEQT